MTLLDIGGVVGVVLVLLAYAGAQLTGLDPKRAPALLLNLVGSALILASMTRTFNLPGFLMEASWAALSLFGLVRLLLRR